MWYYCFHFFLILSSGSGACFFFFFFSHSFNISRLSALVLFLQSPVSPRAAVVILLYIMCVVIFVLGFLRHFFFPFSFLFSYTFIFGTLLALPLLLLLLLLVAFVFEIFLFLTFDSWTLFGSCFIFGKFNVSLDRPALSAAKSYAIAASFVDGKFPKKLNFP